MTPEDGTSDNMSMTTKKAWLWAIAALAISNVVGALLASVSPWWVGPLVNGALFMAVLMFLIYPRWNQGRK